MTAPDSCGCKACTVPQKARVLFTGNVGRQHRARFRDALAHLFGVPRSRVDLWQCADSDAETQTKMFALHASHHTVTWFDLGRIPHHDMLDRFHERMNP